MEEGKSYSLKGFTELINIEKKDFELWLFSIFLILLLTFFFIIYLMPNIFPFSLLEFVDNERLKLYLGFLGTLVLLSSLYSLRKHLEIKKLRWELIEKRVELEKISGRVRELGSLYEVIAGAGKQDGDIQNIFDLVVQNCCEILHANTSSLLTVNEKTDFLEPKAAYGENREKVLKSKIKIGDGIAGWVVKNGKSLLLNEDAQVAKYGSTVKNEHRIHSALSAPIILDEKTIGVLNVNRLGNGSEMFSEADLKLVEIFCQDAVIATKGALLIEERNKTLIMEEKSRLMQIFLNRYVSKELSSQILKEPDRFLKLGGEKKDISILFADIRDFTSFAEGQKPEKVVEILNLFFSKLTKVIFKYNGVVDKYIGDNLMVIFGPPYYHGNHALQATKAALEMQKEFDEIYKGWDSPEFASLGLGIGINSGVVIMGNIGSEDFMDYTVIGDNVNIAVRLETMAQKGQILISDATYKKIEPIAKVKSLLLHKLKGRISKIKIFELTGLIDSEEDCHCTPEECNCNR